MLLCFVYYFQMVFGFSQKTLCSQTRLKFERTKGTYLKLKDDRCAEMRNKISKWMRNEEYKG